MAYIPKTLDEINAQFEEETKSRRDTVIIKSPDDIKVPENAPISPGMLINLIGETKEEENKIFHDLPEENNDTGKKNKTSTDTEDEMEKLDRERLKKEKENQNNLIREEKERIRDQKQLEKSVQRPFKRRRFFVFLFVVFFIIGLAGSFAVYAVTSCQNNNNTFSILSYTLYYSDDYGTDYYNNYVIIENATDHIQGMKDILYTNDDGENVIGSIVALTGGSYAVSTFNGVTKVKTDKVLGSVLFTLPMSGFLKNNIASRQLVAYIAVGLYFILLITGFIIILVKLGKKIKVYKEEYELVRNRYLNMRGEDEKD